MKLNVVNTSAKAEKFAKVFAMLLGISCGCFYASLSRKEENLEPGTPSIIETASYDVAKSKTINETADFLIADDTTLANNLAHRIKVLCWMHTKSIDLDRFDAIKETWGARCTEFIAIAESGEGNYSPNIFIFQNAMSYEKAFHFIYLKFGQHFDWLFRTNGEGYVVVENLRFQVYPYDPKEPIALGLIKTSHDQQEYLSEKAGYALSQGAVKKLAHGFTNGLLCVDDKKIPNNEIWFGACLSEVGVVFAKDTDDEGKELFFEKNLDKYFLPIVEVKLPYPWYQDYKVDHNLDRASNFSIAFSEYRWEEMFVLEYLIYQLRPYGWEAIMPNLPEKISLIQESDSE